jgi:hypothetical protein
VQGFGVNPASYENTREIVTWCASPLGCSRGGDETVFNTKTPSTPSFTKKKKASHTMEQ